jgi:hypothetical protein
MRSQPDDVETPEEAPRDLTVDAGCPTCGGGTEIRIGPWGVRAYCARCARVSRAVVVQGANGMRIFHPAAAA